MQIPKIINEEPVIEIKNDWGSLKIALFGAQIISWKNSCNEELLFLSDKTNFNNKTPLRGGIPLCWPWFGPNPTNKDLPKHGFVRTMVWNLVSLTEIEDETQIILECSSNNQSQKIVTLDFKLILEIVLGSSLSLTLKSINTGTEAFSFSSAFHTYFLVTSAQDAFISGLENTEYIDLLSSSLEPLRQTGLLTDLGAHIDRDYTTTQNSVIHGSPSGLPFKMEKENFPNTVVWNPGESLADTFTDLNAQGASKMVCMEAALCNQISLPAGESYEQKMRLNPLLLKK